MKGRFKRLYESSADVSRHVAEDMSLFAADIGLGIALIDQLELCLVELINNAYEHAYQFADGHPIEVISYLKDSNELIIEISDYGNAMTQNEFEEAIKAEFIEPELDDPRTWATSGRGFIIVVQLTDNLEFSKHGDKNTFIILKKTTG